MKFGAEVSGLIVLETFVTSDIGSYFANVAIVLIIHE
jgi:hypothetical protein